MLLWIKLAIRNALRNLRRTLLTAATVMFGVALVVVALSWIEGIFGEMIESTAAVSGHARVLDTDYAARAQQQPLEEHIADVEPLLERIRAVPGVQDAQPVIATGAVITASDEIGDDFCLVQGGTQAWYNERLNAPEKLVAGRWLSGDPGEVVLGRRIATQLEAEVGDEILLIGRTHYGSMSDTKAQLVGVVAGDAMLNLQAFLPLEEVRWMTDIPDGAVQVLVWTESSAVTDVGPVVQALQELEGMEGLQAEAWYAVEPWNMMMSMMGAIKGFIQLLIVFVAALAIFNTMTMSVMERTAEIGVMRAMGLTRIGALGLFLVESNCIGLLGGVAGAALGALPSWYLAVHGVNLGEDLVDKVGAAFPMKATFYAQLTPEILLNAVILGAVIAVVGALLPALRAASIQPVVAMRARR